MSWFKRLFPTRIKDFAKQAINLLLRPVGWTIAPANAVVLEGKWYFNPVDGFASQHRPQAIDDAAFQDALKHLSAFNAFEGLQQAISQETFLQRLYLAGQLATIANNLPGDFVEFGTYRGATAYCMLKATQKEQSNSHRHATESDPDRHATESNSDRHATESDSDRHATESNSDRHATESDSGKTIHLYDTFSGIPADDLTRREREVGLVGKHAGTSEHRVRENLASFADRIQLYVGRIPSTLDDSGPATIAMMHVDLNLAQPTLDALTWAYPRLVPGGICLLDDYLWQGFEDQRVVVERFFAEQNLTIIGLPTGQGLVLNHPADK